MRKAHSGCQTASLLLVCILCPLAWFSSPASGADFGPVSIIIPPGFDGPVTGGKDGGMTGAWVKRHPGSDMGTLLQITTYDEGSALKDITREQRAEGAKKYLLQFIGGIERRRQNFKLADVESITLAGEPAARVRWTGTLNDLPTLGIMYCVLIDTTIVSFHTQDTGSETTEAMKAAAAAIESIKVH